MTKFAIDELRALPYERKRLESLRMELEAINARLYAPRGASLSDVPVHGTGGHGDDKLVAIISDPRRDCLMELIAEQEKKLALIESVLDLMEPLERRILEVCYISKNGSLAKIMEETNYSDRQIDRIKYSALGRYAHARALDAGKIMAKKWQKNGENMAENPAGNVV